jgi:uncharacterized protein (TIGR00299 family) protein
VTRVAWFQCAAGVAGDMVMAALVDAASRMPSRIQEANTSTGDSSGLSDSPTPDVLLAVMSAAADVVLAPVDATSLTTTATGEAPTLEALTFEPVQRCGVRATWANVVVHDHGHAHDDPHRGHTSDDDNDTDVDKAGRESGHHSHGPHRPARDVLAMIDRAGLPQRVRDRATAVYATLADVEGEIHGIDPADVELHEVGAVDSVVDVVGACAALEAWDVDVVLFSPIAVGHGTVRTQHGQLPNPVPAVADMLARHGAPTVGLDTTMEVATPTGVALMCVLSAMNPTGAPRPGAMPPMQVIATGYGAGSADVAGRPNVVQVVLGDLDINIDAAVSGSVDDDTAPAGSPAVEVSVNVDDVTGEVLAHTVERLLAVGAFDAWITPIIMKKGRPAHTVHALCDEARLAAVRDTIVTETGSLGVRAHRVRRWPQQRHEITVDVDGHPVRVKVASHIARMDVEFDDAAAVAAASGVPVREVIAMAEALARNSQQD